MTAGTKPRVLLAITVYNGRAFVPRCIESAAALQGDDRYELEVLLLDDASPEPGFSEDLATWAAAAGVRHYCTPRNLGIVRNVNLGLAYALSEGFDPVVIANSDVVFPSNYIAQSLAAMEADPKIGSVTAWSNNVSVYSVPNVDPDLFLADQEVVSWLSAVLEGEFGTAAIDIPAGISFAMMIRRQALIDTGVMDPVFGRGYCEETDWSLRSLGAGWRLCLLPSVFVYHQGRGSTESAGLVAGGHSTVPENEAVIDLRYPAFRNKVGAFLASDVLTIAHRNATRRIVTDAVRTWGYDLDLGWLAPKAAKFGNNVHVTLDMTGSRPLVRAAFLGFEATFPFDETDPGGALLKIFGEPPRHIGLGERGDLTTRVFAAFGDVPTSGYRYPAQV